MFNTEIPPKILQDLVLYSVPLLLITSERKNGANTKFYGAIAGSILCSLPIFPIKGSKFKLIMSSVAYLLYLFIPQIYFFALGFILNQSYNTGIFRSNLNSVCKLVSKIELIGYLISESIVIPTNIKFFMGFSSLVVSLLAPMPCCECPEPFELMKSKIGAATMLNSEYRLFLNKEKTKEALISKPYLIDILYMASREKIKILFSIYFSFEVSESIIFLAGSLFILEIPWEYTCILLKAEPNCNVNIRLIVNYLLFIVINFLETNTFFRKK